MGPERQDELREAEVDYLRRIAEALEKQQQPVQVISFPDGMTKEETDDFIAKFKAAHG